MSGQRRLPYPPMPQGRPDERAIWMVGAIAKMQCDLRFDRYRFRWIASVKLDERLVQSYEPTPLAAVEQLARIVRFEVLGAQQ